MPVALAPQLSASHGAFCSRWGLPPRAKLYTYDHRSQAGPLERQCAALAAELREAKAAHEEALSAQAILHADHVAQVTSPGYLA